MADDMAVGRGKHVNETTEVFILEDVTPYNPLTPYNPDGAW